MNTGDTAFLIGLATFVIGCVVVTCLTEDDNFWEMTVWRGMPTAIGFLMAAGLALVWPLSILIVLAIGAGLLLRKLWRSRWRLRWMLSWLLDSEEKGGQKPRGDAYR